jgi:uncharacterized protein YjbI with pentapeptide repeats
MAEELVMIPKLYFWLRRIKRPLEISVIVLSLVIFVALIVVIIVGYILKLGWTGLSQKTLWDWLQLLIVPLALAVIALLFNMATNKTEQMNATQRYELEQQIAKQRNIQDQNIALDKQREDLLQVYLDRMAELLLEKKIRTSLPGSEVRNVARVRTITVLNQLDARRIGYVFAFLHESGLMSSRSDKNIINLYEADFRFVDWRNANLNDANLSGAKLWGADLSRTFLILANLSNATIADTTFFKANLHSANLSESYLNSSIFVAANLYNVNLRGAKLINADLREAILDEADFTGAILDNANLTDSSGITIEELERQAQSLKGAILPNGVIHQ